MWKTIFFKENEEKSKNLKIKQEKEKWQNKFLAIDNNQKGKEEFMNQNFVVAKV